MASPVLIIDGDGKVNSNQRWFPEDEELGAEAHQIVGILGPQGSGKSSLLNAMFGTKFQVRPVDRKSFTQATTKGVMACKDAKNKSVVLLDVEGADARERGKAGKLFQARCAAFAASLSDALLLNMWYHDIGRSSDSTSYALLEAVFAETAKAMKDGSAAKTLLTFVIRDAEHIDEKHELEIQALLMMDVDSMWSRLNTGSPLSDVFEIHVVLLPHPRYRKDEFDARVQNLAQYISGALKAEMSKGIPADGFAVFSQTVWDSLLSSSAPRVPSGPADENTLARMDRVFSEVVQVVNAEIATMTATLNNNEKVVSFGTKASEIYSSAMDTFDTELGDQSADLLVARKREQLASMVDTALQAVFVRQLQILRENALSHFKSAISSEEFPPDFAFFTADSQFTRESQASVMTGSEWSFDAERADLQSFMSEMVAQKKRLQSDRVESAKAYSNSLQVLQMQQAQMNALQQQAMGGISGQWNAQAMYRPPETNVNVTVGYQPGRTTINVGMVPEEGAAAGSGGFTAGFGPMNLGLNLNINI
eukprot:CAMPEP_0184706764 /NCGR_PEP_ID=MMETSP0313-20130426/36928_1 /TAXON_ID=2792 /ORGANISM="Porphyridium aerugineum, Strain SAG 1380-2" /LENGTH=535 /DNA_ID=CAMNT_0027168327 /DNA_START=139 /DNA_END=1746 /DNA_ORIENTATION=+